jgi:hypothetical protein
MANVFASASSLVLIFIEIPLLMRICPTSERFDMFIRRFTTNYMSKSALRWRLLHRLIIEQEPLSTVS